MTYRSLWLALAAAAVLVAPVANARAGGQDAAACDGGAGPAIEAKIVGLKDRTGRMKLELFPATEADFLTDDTILLAAGKVFRRVWAPVPQSGPVLMCIKVPKPGRYALFFTHDRDGKNKFNFWRDGGGVPSNVRIGAAKPKLATATIDVGEGVTVTTIKAQYLRGLSGLGPLNTSE
ncbi:DUF2141 domain-containing protein [Sphingomonas sp. 28-63-12]|uniref:DUF2141 domain-containing protein n=1 Tax=Sphingomonas sp. 28-63-12 TaxID=1970434 RepID=UPI000BDC898F|nr:MAG: hypothetical protein B7Y47_09595 [Sphingomonas sp. 28-63-12]